MKKILTILFIGSLTVINTNAQEKGKVESKTGKENYEEAGKHESIIVSVPYAKLDEVSKSLKKSVRGWGNLNRGNDEYFVDDGELDGMGEDTFDAYTKAFSDGEENFISIAVNLGGAYMTESEHPSKFRAMKKKMIQIANEIAAEGLENRISEQEDVLKDQNKELEDLKDDKEAYKDNIKDLKEEIKENEKAIEKNKDDQEAAKEKIKNQETKIETLKSYKESIE